MRGPYPAPGEKPNPTRKFPISDPPKVIRKVDKPRTSSDSSKQDKTRKY